MASTERPEREERSEGFPHDVYTFDPGETDGRQGAAAAIRELYI